MDKNVTQMPTRIWAHDTGDTDHPEFLKGEYTNSPSFGSWEKTLYHHNDTVEALHTQLEAMAEVFAKIKDGLNCYHFAHELAEQQLLQYQQFKEMNKC